MTLAPKIKVVNRGNAVEIRGQKPREMVVDGAGHPVLDAARKLQYVDHELYEIQLEKGAHEVDAKILEYILEHNPAAAAVFDAQCSFEELPAANNGCEFRAGQYVSDLRALTLASALLAIEACTDAQQLQSWNMQDERKAVKKALHLRDRVLRPADENDQS